jgi:hypothetical protein
MLEHFVPVCFWIPFLLAQALKRGINHCEVADAEGRPLDTITSRPGTPEKRMAEEQAAYQEQDIQSPPG